MSDSANPAGHERSDAPPLLLLALAGGLALTLVLVMAALAAFFPSAVRDQDKGPLQALPQAPRLQVAPRADLHVYREAQDRRLQTYGWSDRAQGRVRVPITQAMRAVAAQDWRSEGR